jgi:hypothetical protein
VPHSLRQRIVRGAPHDPSCGPGWAQVELPAVREQGPIARAVAAATAAATPRAFANARAKARDLAAAVTFEPAE